MDTIDATTLQIGFGIFFTLVIMFVLFLRKISVGDIMTPPPSARSSARQQRINKIDPQFAPQKTALPSPQPVIPTTQKPKTPAEPGKPILGMDRKKVNIAGKVIGAIGAIMLFAPLPESFMVPSMAIAYIGYMIVKASAPPKKKKKTAK
ncbi:MAG: hypothetical protein B5M51_04950 [Anaerolinea sp. 4484_236]|nr:MAG: hypothetical protein B5M51_04950 [Anaerolinea sp. 4484_236]